MKKTQPAGCVFYWLAGDGKYVARIREAIRGATWATANVSGSFCIATPDSRFAPSGLHANPIEAEVFALGKQPGKTRRPRAGDLRLRPTEGTAEPRKEHRPTDCSFRFLTLGPVGACARVAFSLVSFFWRRKRKKRAPGHPRVSNAFKTRAEGTTTNKSLTWTPANTQKWILTTCAIQPSNKKTQPESCVL